MRLTQPLCGWRGNNGDDGRAYISSSSGRHRGVGRSQLLSAKSIGFTVSNIQVRYRSAGSSQQSPCPSRANGKSDQRLLPAFHNRHQRVHLNAQEVNAITYSSFESFFLSHRLPYNHSPHYETVALYRRAASLRHMKLILRDVVKAYGGRRALDGLNLAFEDTSRLALIGPSGGEPPR